MVKRGTFLTGFESLAAKTSLSVRNVRTAISKLESTGELTRQATSSGTIITVCKYETYQDCEDSNDKQNDKQTDKPVTNDRQTIDKQTTTTKKDKNIEERKETKNTPLTPQGEWDGVFPKGSKQKSKTDQQKIRVNRNNELMVRIGKWFDQKETTLWTVSNAISLQTVQPSEEEIEDLENLYLNTDYEFKRRSTKTLLNNWHEDAEKARQYRKTGQHSQPHLNTSSRPSHVAETSRKVDLAQQKYEESVRKLKEDQKNNPENYASDEEVDEFLREFGGNK